MKELDDKSVSSSGGSIARFARWVRAFFSDPWRKTLVIIPLMIMVCNIVPSLHAWTADIPKKEEIHYDKGELVLLKKGKKGIQLGLKKNNKIEYFSCANELNLGHWGCGVEDDLLYAWSGKQAEVGWFYQPAYLFYSQRRLVRLKVEGDEKVSLENVSKKIHTGKEDAVGSIIMALFMIALLLFIIRRLIKMYEKQ